jgi:hypothetical protein
MKDGRLLRRRRCVKVEADNDFHGQALGYPAAAIAVRIQGDYQ